MTIGDILQNEINSALVTFENHSSDNSFMECDIDDFEKGLKIGKLKYRVQKNKRKE